MPCGLTNQAPCSRSFRRAAAREAASPRSNSPDIGMTHRVPRTRGDTERVPRADGDSPHSKNARRSGPSLCFAGIYTDQAQCPRSMEVCHVRVSCRIEVVRRRHRAQARAGPAARNRAAASTPEPLESRRMFAVTAAFAGGVLTVTGDNNANAITVSRNTAGQLRVNNGAVQIQGSAPTVTNTTLIDIRGLGGNDNLALSETNGALPKAQHFRRRRQRRRDRRLRRRHPRRRRGQRPAVRQGRQRHAQRRHRERRPDRRKRRRPRVRRLRQRPPHLEPRRRLGPQRGRRGHRRRRGQRRRRRRGVPGVGRRQPRPLPTTRPGAVHDRHRRQRRTSSSTPTGATTRSSAAPAWPG